MYLLEQVLPCGSIEALDPKGVGPKRMDPIAVVAGTPLCADQVLARDGLEDLRQDDLERDARLGDDAVNRDGSHLRASSASASTRGRESSRRYRSLTQPRNWPRTLRTSARPSPALA